MPTTITQIEDTERDKTILHVKGELMFDDALLLEKIANELRDENQKNLTIDLSDLDLLDSDSASVIKRLNEVEGFEIEGLEFFLQKIVDQAENRPIN